MPAIDAQQWIAVHTYTGKQLTQIPPSRQVSVTWNREGHQVTSCDIKIPTGLIGVKDLMPWVHWCSVWNADGTVLYWTGPIQKPVEDRDSVSISSRDTAAYMERTRCPITKSWDAADPATIAGELWTAMAAHHNLNTDPIVRTDPEGDRFDFSCVADSEMLSDTMDKLVKMGLRWTVIAGVAIFGPVPRTPVTTLQENDFMGSGLQLVRDGSQTANDILVRGQGDSSRARYAMAGLSLQSLVSLNTIVGVSNLDRATRQEARYTAKIRDTIVVPQGALLNPNAPVTESMLIPSTRYVIEAFDLQALVELDQMQVSSDTQQAQVSMTVENVVNLPELMDQSHPDAAIVTGVSR
jgi:hypothetical protein